MTLHASPGGPVLLVVEAGPVLEARLHATYAGWSQISLEDGAEAHGWLPAGAITPLVSKGWSCGCGDYSTRLVPTTHRVARRAPVYGSAVGGAPIGYVDASSRVHVRARNGARASIDVVGAMRPGPLGLWVDAHDLVESDEVSPLAAFLGDLGA
ncbi:MAG: hypothetical protein IPJ34_19930 [Myxococcales bacterium]|nr:hypothetical protein [Myxococcales bacterium]